MAWWDSPYKGGPMVVPASYYPRPCYPPDASGKQPSGDGPDVLAYKRTLSRLGRWDPWEPASWDDSYSNNFAHGKNSNVSGSGVEGFQRQMKIDATGWIGQKTFNALASARVPDGPHKGEMGMDANAANLIAEAFQIYGGQAEPPPSAKATRERALDAAAGWLGYVEGGNNDTIFGDWYGMNWQPYCAMFCAYVYEVQAGGSPSFERASRYSYVPYIVNDAKAKRYGLSVTSSPIPGDMVCFDFQWDGVPDHVGLFESGSASSFKTIEANTSAEGSSGSQSNGGGVYRRSRSSSSAQVTFVRVAEP